MSKLNYWIKSLSDFTSKPEVEYQLKFKNENLAIVQEFINSFHPEQTIGFKHNNDLLSGSVEAPGADLYKKQMSGISIAVDSINIQNYGIDKPVANQVRNKLISHLKDSISKRTDENKEINPTDSAQFQKLLAHYEKSNMKGQLELVLMKSLNDIILRGKINGEWHNRKLIDDNTQPFINAVKDELKNVSNADLARNDAQFLFKTTLQEYGNYLGR